MCRCIYLDIWTKTKKLGSILGALISSALGTLATIGLVVVPYKYNQKSFYQKNKYINVCIFIHTYMYVFQNV